MAAARRGRPGAAADRDASERLVAAAESSGRDPVGGAPTRVVVVGGGMAGLVAAQDCARPGFAVTLLEASERLGGTVASEEVAGLRLDVGAESFATRGGGVADLVESLGLADRVVAPNPAGAWLRLADRTVPMPAGGLLGIPSSPLAADVVAAIGWGGAWRAYLDRLIPVMKIGRVENLGRLVRRRMGRAVLDRLVSPVAGGVYSAPADALDPEVVAHGLNGALTRNGSLSGAVGELLAMRAKDAAARAGGAGRASSRPGSAVAGLRGGLSTLADALAARLRERGGDVRLGQRAVSVRPGPGGEGAEAGARWLVEVAGGDPVPADAVLVALPGPEALAVLAGASDAAHDLGALDWPEPASVEIVSLVVDAPELDAAPRGTGLLVAEEAHGTVAAKALTHSTAKWSGLAEEAGPGRHVLRLSYGRAGRENPAAGLDDAALRDLAVRDASALLGVDLDPAAVRGFARTRWPGAMPSVVVGQRGRIRAVRAALEPLPGLEAAGAWLAGTGLASVVPDAGEAARRLRRLRWEALLGPDGRRASGR